MPRTLRSRRSFLHFAGAGAVAATLGTAACGSTDSSGSGAPTVDVRYLDLSFAVPREPKRVVVMEGRGDLEFALLAGYPVVATANAYDQGKRPSGQFAGRLGDDVTILSPAAGARPKAEEVLIHAPDLVVMRANAYRGDWYNNSQLSGATAILAVEVNRPQWREDMNAQLAAVGRTANAQQYVADYDAKVAATKRDLAGTLAGKRIAMVTTTGSKARGTVLVWAQTFGTAIGREIGMDVLFGDRQVDPSKGSFEASLENLDVLAGADLILHQDTDGSIADVQTWRTLPAVQAGRVAKLNPQYNNGLVLTASALVDDLAAAAQSLR
ncbi:ABC transporter substrate-binding protein [Tsukamurella sp. DT100]|uniref:ABC transporter substrate-binding protein n=1 Tax=Tsukamurella sp. DT100 TaxID=3393415 RepID=UPI003CF0F40F